MAKDYNNRWKQTQVEINAAFPDKASRLKRRVEPVFVQAEFCKDLMQELFTDAWEEFRLLKGDLPIQNFIAEKGLVRCLKKEATHLLIVGKKKNGLFIRGQHKNYWLKKL